MSDSPARTRIYETPPDVRLCPIDQIADPGARNFVLQIRDAFFHGFVVRRGDQVHGFVDSCPHMGLPLSQKLDDYLTPRKDYIVCAWHGALFRPEDGVCVGGPCTGQRLRPWPVRVEDGWLKTGAKREG